MIYSVDVSEIVVGAHAGAVAPVIVLLDNARLFRGNFQVGADEFADPLVHLLPQIDVMRIERVVEIEHPGIDMSERAFLGHSNLNSSSRRKRGPIRRRGLDVHSYEPALVWGVSRTRTQSCGYGSPLSRGRRKVITASQSAASCRRSTSQ